MSQITQAKFNIPVLPLRGLVVFPKMMLHFDVARKKSVEAITKAMNENQLIFLAAQKDASVNDPTFNEIYKVGVVTKIVQVIKQPDDITRVVVEGQYRAKIDSQIECDTHLEAIVAPIVEKKHPNTARDLALVRLLKGTFENYMELTPKLPTDILFKIGLSTNSGELADYVAGNVILDYSVKQSILETINVSDRLETLIDALQNEIYILEIEQEILDKSKNRIDQSQREYYLREQLKIIEEELGVDESPEIESQKLKDKVKELHLSDDNEKALLKECSKLEKMPYGSNEAALIRTYIDTCLELPWNDKTEEKIDIKKVRKSLDKNHYGLSKVKERIIEQLAVRKLTDKAKGQIICLVGPPGVGKTSIAQSIATAINRKSERIALGGVKDEAEIRGHRRTYIGSMPGRIISAIKKIKVNNPLLILDEVDKLSNDYKGDPTSALLEVLDAEQNHSFQDHYIDLPFDLSNVMFITTANDYDAIPAPLRDRMEVIELDSYTRQEKFFIAKKHLIPKQLDLNGLNRKNFKITDKAIYMLIDSYTREAGVRTLERTIASVMRKSAVKIIDKNLDLIKVTDKDVESILGPVKYIDEIKGKKDEIGVVNGLAWTSVGGTLLPIECAVMPGTGKIELTGSLGDVMQESAKAAITCIRTRAQLYGIDADFYKNRDIHIHAVEGSVPKDGPSAGITMATAICSALSCSPVRSDFAMTGEITLRGKVLAIGGLKEKTMAAYKSGIRNVIIPKDNERDLVEIDDTVKSNINFIPVSTIDEVLRLVLKPVIKTSDKPKTDIIVADNKENNSTCTTITQ
ncbi:MAG: endopeptidase La [Ruminococcaceae bacterium]|nr:endopeptidase La [Oscillospiraceae bacterium]